MLGNLRSIIEGLLRSMVLNEYGGVGSGVSQRGGLFWLFLLKEVVKSVVLLLLTVLKKNLRGEISNLSLLFF